MNSKRHLDDDDTSIYMSAEELMLLNCGVGENSWEPLGLQGDLTSPSYRKSVLNIHWKDWCWSWNSNTLVTTCKELTHWKRLWCWEGLGAGGEGDGRGWDGWMASLTRWTWIEWTPGVGDGQGGLVCWDSLGHKESDMTDLIHMFTLMGNVGMILLIRTDSKFHILMYLFLSFANVCYSSTITPKMLVDLLSEKKTISFAGCFLQMYFFLALATTECILFGLMAHDRYVAICNPFFTPWSCPGRSA